MSPFLDTNSCRAKLGTKGSDRSNLMWPERHAARILWISFCLLIPNLGSLFGSSQLQALPEVRLSTDSRVLAECASLRELLDGGDRFSALANPVLRNESQIEGTAEEYREMLDCLNSVPVSVESGEWARTLRYHLRLFLSFAAPEDTVRRVSSLELVDLSATRDPAVRRLREQVGLIPPEGLVFVRYFRNRLEMPVNIRRAFDSPQTRAVTLSSRYVAVLTSATSLGTRTPIMGDALRSTFSHELVHAFLNARLNPDVSREGFPRWFHEAMAIHFSDSGRAHISVDPVSGSLLRMEPTVRYEQYERVFRYLESEMGSNRFYSEIRTAVDNIDAAQLYRTLGVESYDELAATAELWWRWWPIPVAFVRGKNAWWFAGLFALVFVGAVAGWRRWQPAVAGSALELGVNAELVAAAEDGDMQALRHLLRSGADPDAEDDHGNSALVWAVWINSVKATELLLDRGAHVRPGILELAESRDSAPEIVRMLADAITKDDDDSVAFK